MKFLKNNFKLILACIITAILVGGIVYAATSASEVTYSTSKNGEVQTVADALNDLYNNKEARILSETVSFPDSNTLSYELESIPKILYIYQYNRTSGNKNYIWYSLDYCQTFYGIDTSNSNAEAFSTTAWSLNGTTLTITVSDKTYWVNNKLHIYKVY